MSHEAPNDRHTTSSPEKCVNSINAGIDSSFNKDPAAHRGSLTPSELDSIHQTNSFKQAEKLAKEDNRELAAKTKQLHQTKEPIKQQ